MVNNEPNSTEEFSVAITGFLAAIASEFISFIPETIKLSVGIYNASTEITMLLFLVLIHQKL